MWSKTYTCWKLSPKPRKQRGQLCNTREQEAKPKGEEEKQKTTFGGGGWGWGGTGEPAGTQTKGPRSRGQDESLGRA